MAQWVQEKEQAAAWSMSLHGTSQNLHKRAAYFNLTILRPSEEKIIVDKHSVDRSFMSLENLIRQELLKIPNLSEKKWKQDTNQANESICWLALRKKFVFSSAWLIWKKKQKTEY